jgi:hypothetical protein
MFIPASTPQPERKPALILELENDLTEIAAIALPGREVK